MKKRIHLFVTTLLLLLSNSIWSQFDDFITLDENDFRTLRMVDDEFLIDKDLYNFYQGKNLNAFEENFNFWGDSGFGGSNFAVINAGLMIEAQKRAALQDWYQKQRELIKDEIEEHYGTEFDSFEKAVDRTFVDFGKKNHRVFFNFNNNVINLRNSHLNTNKVYKSRNQINLRELHHLNYRKQEILSGNINNSIFTFSEIYGGIKLRDIRDINAINRNWNTIKGFLDVNLPTEENARYHSEGLRNLDGTFDNFMLGLQRDYYHRELNPGQRLWLEQFSINFLQATRFSNPFSGPHTINFNVPGGWSKGLSIPVGTEDVLQNYLWAHAERSVFDPNYYLNVLDEILKNNGYLPIYGDLSKLPRYTGYYYKQAAIAQANDRRNAAFNNLVDAAPSEEDIKIDLAITALGPENNKLLENNPDLRREVVEYLEVNDISQYATDGINYLFTQFRTNPEFIVNADLFKATKSSRQTASDSNLALQIGFNQQAITEGITNFGNVLAELLRDNVNIEFEGSLIKTIFKVNEIEFDNTISSSWFGERFSFVVNDGNSIRIEFGFYKPCRSSFQFNQLGTTGSYEATLNNLTVDVDAFTNRGGFRTTYSTGELYMRKVYVYFTRFSGSMVTNAVEAFDKAEDELDTYFQIYLQRNGRKPTTTEMAVTFMKALNTNLAPFGGIAKRSPSIGNNSIGSPYTHCLFGF